jgi:hypothetical protein
LSSASSSSAANCSERTSPAGANAARKISSSNAEESLAAASLFPSSARQRVPYNTPANAAAAKSNRFKRNRMVRVSFASGETSNTPDKVPREEQGDARVVF